VPAPAVPGPLEALREQALADNPTLGLLQARVALAEAELRGLGAAASASLDLVAQASEQRLSGSGSYGPASNDGRQQMIGLQLRVPIYTGGGREARQQEALHALERTRAELDQARLQIGQQTRAAWLALDTAPARLTALQAAFDAARAPGRHPPGSQRG
jgi:outer membrane protein